MNNQFWSQIYLTVCAFGIGTWARIPGYLEWYNLASREVALLELWAWLYRRQVNARTRSLQDTYSSIPTIFASLTIYLHKWISQTWHAVLSIPGLKKIWQRHTCRALVPLRVSPRNYFRTPWPSSSWRLLTLNHPWNHQCYGKIRRTC